MGQKILQNSLAALSLVGILIGGQPNKNQTNKNDNELIELIGTTKSKTYHLICDLFHKKKFTENIASDIKDILRHYHIKGVELNEEEINKITESIVHDIDNNGLIFEIFNETQESQRMVLALIYAIIFGIISKKIISKIKEEHELASNLTLGYISSINGLSYIANGRLDFTGITYVSVCMLGMLMIYINKQEKIKILEGTVKPNQKNAREIGLKLYEHIMNGDDAYIIYDLNAENHERKVQIWNNAVEKLTGYSASEIRGLTYTQVTSLLYGYDNEVLKRRMDLNNYYKTFVFEIRTKEGKIVPIAWKVKQLVGGRLLLRGSQEETEIRDLLRKDNHFECNNLIALREDFQGIINKNREADNKKGAALSLVFGDIDCFGEFNKTYGHRIGDIVLEFIITRLKEEFKRTGDGIYRKGGDEFIVLCAKTGKGTTGTKIDNLKSRVARSNIIVNYKMGKIEISIKEHENEKMALDYFNNIINQKGNKDMLYKMGLGLVNTQEQACIGEDNNINGTLVLPPICSTWGVTEIKNSELGDNRYSEEEASAILGNLVDKADFCTLNGKNGGKNTVIIEKEKIGEQAIGN